MAAATQFIVRVGNLNAWLTAFGDQFVCMTDKLAALRFTSQEEADEAIHKTKQQCPDSQWEYHVEPFNLLDVLVEHISSARFNFTSEAELQAGLAQHLAGFKPQVEVRLNEKDRVDLVVEDIGIEVKVDGSRADVLRQLHRYANSGVLGALILVTNRTRHTVPPTINGIPVILISLVLQEAF